MAPERRTGDGASERSDVYSLGAVLLELLTGEAPRAEDVWGNEWTRGTRTVQRADDLRRICAQAMHPDPRQRLGSAAELSRLLERSARCRQRCRRTSVVSGLVVSVVIAAGAATLQRELQRFSAHEVPYQQPPQLSLQFAMGGADNLTAITAKCHAPADVEVAMFFVLPDGRLLPVSPIEAIRVGDVQVAHPLHSAPPLLLSDRNRTAMFVAATMPRSETASSRTADWSDIALPSLPAGVQLRIGSAAGKPSASPAALRSIEPEVRALQDRLIRTFDCFDAVLFTPPAVGA